MTTKTLAPGEKCPTCGRRTGPISHAQLMAEVVPGTPDPIKLAHPVTPEEKAAYEGWIAAKEALQEAHAALRDAKAARHRASGGYQGAARRQGTRYEPSDPQAAKESDKAIAIAGLGVEEAEAEAQRLHRIYRDLASARDADIRRARFADQAEKRQARQHQMERARVSALEKVRRILGIGAEAG